MSSAHSTRPAESAATDEVAQSPLSEAAGSRDLAPDTDLITQEIGRAILGDGPSMLDPAEPGDHLAIVKRAAAAEGTSRSLLQQSVAAARASGHSWSTIGSELGLSRQGVQQRFGGKQLVDDDAQYRWLGPVTAFDEMGELEIAGRLGWHTVEAGMLKHKMVRTATQWEHRRVVWTGSRRRYEKDGWQVGCLAFPWVYLIRDRGVPAERDPSATD